MNDSLEAEHARYEESKRQLQRKIELENIDKEDIEGFHWDRPSDYFIFVLGTVFVLVMLYLGFMTMMGE
jgi:hypothetical protein